MAFPQDPLPIKQEMYIDGAWVDITTRTRNAADVSIRRGYSSEQGSLSPGQAFFTLENPDGFFSNRLPTSVNYRKLGRNTPFRVSVTESVTSLRLMDYSTSAGAYDGARAWTADKAVLDVTGDLDLRADIWPDNWRGGYGQFIASKYVLTGNQRSWTWYLTAAGNLRIIWSVDGTAANRVAAASTEPVPDGGRCAVRVTLDVDNGAAGNTVTFYTSDTISGSWTQLGDPVVTSGVTSVFASTAPLEVGTIADGTGRGSTITQPDIYPMVGRVYGFELWNGIGGTRVARMDATGQAAGTTSWSDGLGTPNTWALTNSAEITGADYRFRGEIARFPQDWDTTGRNVEAAVTAADLFQRLGQGAKALESPIKRLLIRQTMDGYWPMEAGTSATHAPAAVGVQGFIRDASFSSDATLPGTAGVLSFSADTGYASGNADPRAGNPTSVAYALFYFKIDVPASTVTIMNVYFTSGSVYRADFGVGATTYTITLRDDAGTILDSSTVVYGAGAEPGQWIAMRLKLTDSGGGVAWEWAWYPVGGVTLYGVSGSVAGSPGKPKSWISYPFTGKSTLSIAHVALAREDLGFNEASFTAATNGHTGETVPARFARLCQEQAVPYWIVGSQDGAEQMGVQRPASFLTLLQECADLDGGFLYGPRDKFGVALQLRRGLLNRTGVTFDYSAGHLTGKLTPDEGDAFIRNDVTVTRPNGGSARSVQREGPLNINDPADDPDGVGTYDTTPTRVAYEDARLPALAQWEKFLGTQDVLRYPRVEANLAQAPYVASASLTAQVRALDLGRQVTLTNLPSFLPPDDADTMVRGYTETLRNRSQEFTWNTVPYDPYRVNDLTGSAASRYRAAASSTVLAGAVTTTGTSMVFYTPSGKLWRRSSGAPADTYPMNVTVAGEVVTATALANVTLSYVAVGAVSHANNASVTPGLPAGLATGDLMFMLVAIRSTGGAAPNTPTGWWPLSSSTNVALYAKLAGAGEAAPTVTFSGGAAGDDTSGQIAAFRPSSPLLTTLSPGDLLSVEAWQTNASGQDIAYRPVPLVDGFTDNALILYLGWKQDDWTSVASPGTEIDEPDTVTGNDQGIVWAYQIQTTRTAVAPGSFTVTGGAAAVSKSAVVVVNLRHQLVTVTRSVNGVVKAHTAAEDAVQVTEPFYVTR